MGKSQKLAELGNVYDDSALSNRNLIINGDMQVAQRGTSFTADNVFTLDRWKSSDGTGGSPARTASQEEFTLGQTYVPNARYYFKHNQTAASTNSNSALQQKIENVTRFDGTTITLSFYAKASADLDLYIRFIQDFGTGGSPSSDVTVSETITVGTTWKRYTVTKTLGSLSGKTLGTDGDHTSFLNLNIDFQTSSTFTFEATLFQLEYGETATPFEHRSYGDELTRCRRYLYRINGNSDDQTAIAPGYFYGTTTLRVCIQFPVEMRTTPTVSADNSYLDVLRDTTNDTSVTLGSSLDESPYSTNINIGSVSSTTVGEGGILRLKNNTSAYIQFDAEL